MRPLNTWARRPASSMRPTLAAEEPRLETPSELVRREVGVAGVAESAALAAAGPDGNLVVPKTKSRRATCAIALAPVPLDPAAIGQPRGRLAVVGLGPRPRRAGARRR